MPKKFIKSFKYAREGAAHALKTQRNLWIHIGAAALVLSAAAWLRVSRVELALLVLTICGVIVTEMLNTAIEALVDILSPEHRREAAIAKNVGAGAVLLAAAGAVVIGLIIFLPRVMQIWAK